MRISFEGALADLPAFLRFAALFFVLALDTVVFVQRFRPHAAVIRMVVVGEPTAGSALAAGMAGGIRSLAQERLGESLRKGGLADASGTVEQDGVRQARPQLLQLPPSRLLPRVEFTTH